MQYLLKRKLELHKAKTKKNKRGRAGADINVLCYSCSQWELYDFFTEGGGEKWKFVGKNTNCFLFVGRAVRIGHGAEAGEGGGEGNGDGTAWARVFFFSSRPEGAFSLFGGGFLILEFV